MLENPLEQSTARPASERFDLSSRVALISGGSRGLGLEIARSLGQAGARVAIAARRQEWLDAAAVGLAGRGIETLALRADVSKGAQAQRLVEQTLERFGSLDVLVNAAGVSWGQPTLEMPAERVRQVLEVNVVGTFLLCQAAARHMLPRGQGKIVNVASAMGLAGVPEEILPAVGYTASKGAIIAMTRDLAVKWAPRGVCVNAVAPWFFPTRMTQGVLAQHEQEVVATVPMRRLGRPEDITGVVLFLASAAADYVTGQVIAVDGGFTAG
jgi:gluconate 5-dehydrogenase